MTEQSLDWRDPTVEHYWLRWRMLHSGRVVYDKLMSESLKEVTELMILQKILESIDAAESQLFEQTLTEIDEARQRCYAFDKERLRQSFYAALERTEVEWQR